MFLSPLIFQDFRFQHQKMFFATKNPSVKLLAQPRSVLAIHPDPISWKMWGKYSSLTAILGATLVQLVPWTLPNLNVPWSPKRKDMGENHCIVGNSCVVEIGWWIVCFSCLLLDSIVMCDAHCTTHLTHLGPEPKACFCFRSCCPLVSY